MLTPMKDSTSGNIVVAIDEEEKRVVLSKDGGKTSFYELAVFSWEENERCLEDIREGVELVLHKKDGGIWHLGDEPLEPATNIDMSQATIEWLPFQKAAFAMWDPEEGEVIALLVTQSKMGIYSVQAYVGEGSTLDGAVLTKRGTPEVVAEAEVEVPGKNEYKFFINLGPNDVCQVVYCAGMSPYEVYPYRGSGRMRMDGRGSKLVVLDPRPAFFTWRFEGEGNTAIAFTKRR